MYAGPRRPARGFTLFETVLVIGLLTLAATILMKLQRGIFPAQAAARDELVGLEIQRACAERLLAVRRTLGYVQVKSGNDATATCYNLGNGLGNFVATPTVTLVDAGGATVTTCGSATCTATITVANASGPAVPLPALTLRLTNY